MKLGKTIKEIRKSKGLNQAQLAEKSGISQTALSQIESDKRFPNQITLQNLCNALGTKPSAIYILSATIDDVPEENKETFNTVFPQIKSLLEKIFIYTKSSV